MERFEDEKSMVDREIDLLRGSNKLTYLSPTMAGLISIRTSKTYPFSNQVASWGQTIIMNNNTGDDFLYGPNCYLRLAWTVPAMNAPVANSTASMDFGYGSIMNVIREVVLTHSSGQVLEQINYSNVLSAIKTRYYTSNDDQFKLSSMLGGHNTSTPANGSSTAYAGGFNIISPNTQAAGVAPVLTPATNLVTVAAAAAGNAPAVTYVSMIPMSYLFGVFDRRDQLIPASLIAGSTIQIRFETLGNSATFTGTGDFAVAATAQNFFSSVSFSPSVVYDSCRVFDDVQRAILQEQSSIDGLQFSYCTYFPIQQNFGGTGVNFDVQYSASVTQAVMAVAATVPGATSGADNFTFPNVWSQYQWRIASDYKPFQPVVIPGQFICAEAYQYALATWQSVVHTYDQVDEPEGGVDLDLPAYATFAALLGTTLERSPVGLQLTGVPTNNSSLLNLNATKTNAAHNVTVFLHYLRVANLRGGSCAVDR